MHNRSPRSAAAAGLLLAACLTSLAADQPGILTPPPGPAPRTNGPSVYGARPGRPFLYRIPCTGRRPMRFAADGLPASLSLDAETGIIRGKTPDQPGTYPVTLRASNREGKAVRLFR